MDGGRGVGIEEGRRRAEGLAPSQQCRSASRRDGWGKVCRVVALRGVVDGVPPVKSWSQRAGTVL